MDLKHQPTALRGYIFVYQLIRLFSEVQKLSYTESDHKGLNTGFMVSGAFFILLFKR